MRLLAMLLLMAWATLPVLAARKVTVVELKRTLDGAHGNSDAHLARRLSGLVLTERLDAKELARWEAALPGAKSRQALTLLADMSGFLDSPVLAGNAASRPEMEAQLQMVSLGVQYVKSVLPRLPNFTATRETRRYHEEKPVGANGQETMMPYEPMYYAGSAIETLLFRNGEETVDPQEMTQKGGAVRRTSLTTYGVFGPILGVVVGDAIRGRLVWGRWEQDAGNPVAVFRFSVPKEKSHYQVEFCCFRLGKAGNREFREFAAYHGEVALDPITGTVLRLQIVADMEPSAPILKSGILVDYQPVVIAGTTYFCPVRSVSLQVEWERGTGSLQTSLNDVAFSRYHMLGSESRVLTGDEGEQH